jgi:hypothetical protein
MNTLGLGRAGTLEDQAMGLADAVPILLDRIARAATPILAELAQLMMAGDWAWGPSVLAALGAAPLPGRPRRLSGLDIWSRLPEWEEAGPIDPPSHYPVDPADARIRLADLVQGRSRHGGEGAQTAETRPQQADYAAAVRRRLPAARARRTSRRRCWPRPAPASARRWAISRRQASGPRRTTARCGSRPIPATCKRRSPASSTGSTPTRCKSAGAS